jgi:hypothetical protein
VLVVVSWQVVFSHRVSSCVWVLSYVDQEFEGLGEQVGGKGGIAGVPGGSPLVCSCSLSSSGTSHIPHLKGGGQWWWVCCQCHLARRGAAQPQGISKINFFTC